MGTTTAARGRPHVQLSQYGRKISPDVIGGAEEVDQGWGRKATKKMIAVIALKLTSGKPSMVKSGLRRSPSQDPRLPTPPATMLGHVQDRV